MEKIVCRAKHEKCTFFLQTFGEFHIVPFQRILFQLQRLVNCLYNWGRLCFTWSATWSQRNSGA